MTQLTDAAKTGTFNTAPAWSPDGSQIAFQTVAGVSNGVTDDIYRMGITGANPTRLTDDTSDDGYPSWSPDGTTLAFARRFVGTQATELDLMNASDGANKRILIDNAVYRALAWSPDGTQIAYTCTQSVSILQYDVCLIDVATGQWRRLTNTAGFSETAPAWSPDGEQIAYIRGIYTNFLITGYAFVIDTHGIGPATQLTGFLLDAQGLDWSADGSQIIMSKANILAPLNQQSANLLARTMADGQFRDLTSVNLHIRDFDPDWH